jgi:hypothetical protein
VPVTPEEAHRQLRMYACFLAERKKKLEENRGARRFLLPEISLGK